MPGEAAILRAAQAEARAQQELQRSREGVEAEYVFVAETLLPTRKGAFRMRAYRNPRTFAEPVAMMVGVVEGQSAVPVRVHDQCQTSEVFGSLKCDCKEQLDYALRYMQHNGPGLVIYLPQEGRGIGLANKVAAYAQQERGLDTVDANRVLGLPDDAREYGAVRDILLELGIRSVRLMTNNPRKIRRLAALGIVVEQRIPCVVHVESPLAQGYLQAKVSRMGHLIDG